MNCIGIVSAIFTDISLYNFVDDFELLKTTKDACKVKVKYSQVLVYKNGKTEENKKEVDFVFRIVLRKNLYLRTLI